LKSTDIRDRKGRGVLRYQKKRLNQKKERRILQLPQEKAPLEEEAPASPGKKGATLLPPNRKERTLNRRKNVPREGEL